MKYSQRNGTSVIRMLSCCPCAQQMGFTADTDPRHRKTYIRWVYACQITALLFRPSYDFFQNVCFSVENSVPAELKSCRVSIFLRENFTRNRISRWSNPTESKSECLAWGSFKHPPILACAAIRRTGFLFGCLVPRVSVNRLGFPRHLPSPSGWSSATHPGSQRAQRRLSTGLKGNTV